jgi:hypothetical protein
MAAVDPPVNRDDEGDCFVTTTNKGFHLAVEGGAVPTAWASGDWGRGDGYPESKR